MTEQAVVNRYWKNRGEGMGAMTALSYAKYLEKGKREALEWEENARHDGHIVRLEREGFDVLLSKSDAHDDYYLSHDYLGKFKSERDMKPKEYAKALNHHRLARLGEWDQTRACKYFVPAISIAEHYRGLREMGYGRTLARELSREYVMRDYKRAVKLGEDWCFLNLDVTVYKDGVELGSASLCGVESDSDDGYIDETVLGLIPEAILEAKRTLKKLCSCPEEKPDVNNAGTGNN